MGQLPLLSLDFEEFAKVVQDMGLEKFRAIQVWEWIFRKSVFDFDRMTNISKEVRAALAERFPEILPRPREKLTADDGTFKLVIPLPGELATETVAIPEEDALTVCLSCQTGCPVGCLFCRTGTRGGRKAQNLTADEILIQFLSVCREARKKPTNVVFMGMGEPFLNRKAVFTAIDRLTDSKGIGMATRRITISTVGIIDGIKELADRPGEVNLAVSLHSADEDLRTRIIPMNRTHSLARIRKAVSDYISRTSRRVTFEVVLLDKVNDHISDAMNLAAFCKDLLCHVNLVRFNPFPGCSFKPSSQEAEKEFKKVLKKEGIPVTIRKSRGGPILAACGQLAGN